MKTCRLQEAGIIGTSRVAFGAFDGIHIGHRRVIDALVGYEAEVPVVLSFEEAEQPVLTTEEEKAYLLEHEGISVFCSMPAAEAAAMTAREFAEKVLCGTLHASSVVCGENVAVGSDGADLEALRGLGEEFGFKVDAVPMVEFDGEIVTTDAAKKAVEESDFVKLKKLLGREYIMIGEVVHGKAEGRQHGMPTANLGVAKNKLFPPFGVYGTLSVMDGAFYRGFTNVGLRPSADEIPIPTIETFLFQFSRDIYGKKVVLEVHEYIRGIMKFSGGLDEVRAQIDKDMVNVKAALDEVIAGRKRGI